MIIRSAEYKSSCTKLKDCPSHKLPEYAFVGRSNVGKSSLINMLLNRKALTKISSKPGKTRTINYFLVNNEWFLVDMPGFGFAKVSQELRKQWDKMILEYLLNRKNLSCVFMLIDSRIPLQQKDKDFMLLLGRQQIPFVIVSTKMDQVKLADLHRHQQELHNFIDTYWEERPKHILSSSKEKKGREEILSIIEAANKVFFIT